MGAAENKDIIARSTNSLFSRHSEAKNEPIRSNTSKSNLFLEVGKPSRSSSVFNSVEGNLAFTDKQIAIIKKSHAKFNERATDNCTNIYLRLFQEKPEYKQMIPNIRFLEDMELLYSEDIRVIAGGMSSGIREMVKFIENKLLYEASLRAHANKERRNGIRKEHIEAIFPHFLECLRGLGMLNSSSAESWAIFFDQFKKAF